MYGHTFGGVGTYTVAELFFIAGSYSLHIVEEMLIHSFGIPGLSPFLSEGELFGCPSRLARLCEALWTFAHRAHTKLAYDVIPICHSYISLTFHF